jgi:hypothetical protein
MTITDSSNTKYDYRLTRSLTVTDSSNTGYDYRVRHWRALPNIDNFTLTLNTVYDGAIGAAVTIQTDVRDRGCRLHKFRRES